MEALPRLPMLSFDLKHSPEYVEFGPTLKQAAIQVSRDVMGCTTLKKYYAQLLYLQGRFPMVEGGEAAIAFTWEDVQTGRDTVICDIKFEQACILYNIGSLHSLLGALDTRHNAEGMKVSCTHFQCAAWAFELLRNNFCSSSMSTDMSFELLNFHVTLMLAQAQECILEKSIFDNRKNSITAKVAAKEWSRRLIMKTTFYQSITFFFLGREAEDAEKPGDCLAYFTAAKDELNKATQLAKNEVPEVTDSLHFAKDVMLGKYESAKKDNDFVYHAKVPAIDSLPEIKGASLVKGIPFDPNDKEISGPDIFQKLVPMEAHEASSVYSEEKAKLSRTVIGEVDQKNMELDQFMSSLQLDIEQFMPKPNIIPDNLMEKCAAMSVRTNAIKELTDSMTNVSGLATEVELSLEEIQQLINDDIEKTEQMEKQYGKKNPSPVLQRLQEELETYRQQHKEGNQLNATLHKAMNTHTNNLKTLKCFIAALLFIMPPKSAAEILKFSRAKWGAEKLQECREKNRIQQKALREKWNWSRKKIERENTAEDDAVVAEIRRLYQKVSEMKDQRKLLVDQFREKIHNDDITNVLVTQEVTDKDAVFKEQLKKHDQIVTYIRQNLSAQDNILRFLTDVNAKFALIRQAIAEANSKRDKAVHDLILSYEKYEELLAKSQKGIEYYKKLLENVTKTLERCRSECKVRHEEREMLLAKFAPKAPAPSRPSAPKPGSNTIETPTSTTDPKLNSVSLDEDLTSMTALHMQSSLSFQSLPPSFEGPKLKDFLPFMKPRSFGSKATVSKDSVSSPPIVPENISFGSAPYDGEPHYHGLDPSLAAVLPATLAQYLASKSSGISTLAGGTRNTSSPQQSLDHGSPRHSSSKVSVSQPSSFMAQHNPSNPGGMYSNALPPPFPPAAQFLQNKPPPFKNFGPVASQRSSEPDASSFNTGPQNSQHNFPAGMNQPHQNPSMMRNQSVSIVSSASQAVNSSGIDSINQAPYHQPPVSLHQFPYQVPSQQHDVHPHGQQQAVMTQGQQQGVLPQGPAYPHTVYGSVQDPTKPQHWSQNQMYNSLPGLSQFPPASGQISSGTGHNISYHGQSTLGAMDHGFTSSDPGQIAPNHGYIPPTQGQFPSISGQTSHIAGYTAQSQGHTSQIAGHTAPTQGQTSQIAGHTAPIQGMYPHGPGQSTLTGQVAPTYMQMTQIPRPVIGNITSSSGSAASGQAAPPTAPGQDPPTALGHAPGSFSYYSQYTSQPYGHVNYNVQPQTPALGDNQINNGQNYNAQPYGQYPGQPKASTFHPNESPHQSPTRNTDYGKQGPMPVSGQSFDRSNPQGLNISDSNQHKSQLTHYQAGVQPTPDRVFQNGLLPYGQPVDNISQSVGPANTLQSQVQGPQYLVAQNQIPASQASHLLNQPQTSLPNTPPIQGSFQSNIPIGQQFLSQSQPPVNYPTHQTSEFPPPAQSISQLPPTQQQGTAAQPGVRHNQNQQFLQQPTFQQMQQPAQQFGQIVPPLPHQSQLFHQKQQPVLSGHYSTQPMLQPQGHSSNMAPASTQQNLHPQMVPASTQQNLHPQMAPASTQQNLHPQVAPAPTQQNVHPQMPLPLQPSSISNTIRPSTPLQVIAQAPVISTHIPVTPTSPMSSVKDSIISPQVLTDQERRLQKEEAIKNQAMIPINEPYSSQSSLMKLLTDVEAFGKFVDELSVTILGVSRLDTLWKSLLDSQDAATKKQSMAIARCYPMKNRDPDIMPYDETRVVLTSTKDDYINASWLNDLAPSCPKFITTQAPLTLTMADYWAMVYEQGSEVLVQITSEYETGKNYPVYYPVEKDKNLEQGVILLSLQSVKFRQFWVERIIYLKNTQSKQGRALVHLQFKNWPVSFGIGRTGVFTLVYAAMQEVLHGNGLVDLPGLAKRMLQKRRGILNKKEQLKCCYDVVLYFAEEYLKKRGMLVKNPHFSKKQLIRQSPKHQPHQPPAQDDIVLGTVNLQTICENVGKFHVQNNSNDCNKKEEMFDSMNQNLSRRSLESLSSITSLPDIVQQHTESGLGEKSCSSSYGSDLSSLGCQNIHTDSRAPQDHKPDVSKPNSAISFVSEHAASLADHNSKSFLTDPVTLPVSLAQLQDPATFTMGSPDAKKKNKITKANFNQSQSSLQGGTLDPSDPLGSLDPLWTLAKK
ncbi:Tyrosine-protein phosphatase non-receptor type 23 [Bulinus truncatus]|nr:Tyrosine-protein phosphatase non-receptor type 23 [Bulinus truncatus]